MKIMQDDVEFWFTQTFTTDGVEFSLEKVEVDEADVPDLADCKFDYNFL